VLLGAVLRSTPYRGLTSKVRNLSDVCSLFLRFCSHCYEKKVLGGTGVKRSSQVALLNANYLMGRLKDHYKVKFVDGKGHCAHEFLIDFAEFEESAGLRVMDFAKRLIVSSPGTRKKGAGLMCGWV
jgi:glycine cleavage system protein P-like pyridoxal-binding family